MPDGPTFEDQNPDGVGTEEALSQEALDESEASLQGMIDISLEAAIAIETASRSVQMEGELSPNYTSLATQAEDHFRLAISTLSTMPSLPFTDSILLASEPELGEGPTPHFYSVGDALFVRVNGEEWRLNATRVQDEDVEEETNPTAGNPTSLWERLQR